MYVMCGLQADNTTPVKQLVKIYFRSEFSNKETTVGETSLVAQVLPLVMLRTRCVLAQGWLGIHFTTDVNHRPKKFWLLLPPNEIIK